MKKFAPWVAVIVALVVVLALLVAPKLTANKDDVTVQVTSEVTAAVTEAPTAEPTEAPTEVPTEVPTEAPTEAPTEEPAPELPADTVATVNGKPVVFSEVESIAQNIMYSYSQYGYDFSSAEMQSMVYSMAQEYAIQLELMDQKAVEWGLDQLSEEEKAAVEADVAAEWDKLIDTYMAYYMEVPAEATEEELAAARVTAVAGLESLGYTWDALYNDFTSTVIYEKVEAEMVKDVVVTDEDVKAAFDAQVAADEQKYGQDIATYEYMTQYYGMESYYQPEGYRGIVHILLKVDEELLKNYHSLVAELEEQEESDETEAAEPSEEPAATETPAATEEPAVTAAPVVIEEGGAHEAPAANAPANANAAVVSTATDLATPADLEPTAEPEVPADLATAADLEATIELTGQEKVNAAYLAIIASVQSTIDEINQKLADGVSFEDLIVEYGQDPGMKSEPAKSQGYSVHADSIIWDPAFVQAAFSVENVGDIAQPVVGNNGVHIVKYLRDVPAGAVELTEELAATLRANLLAEKENEQFNTVIAEWMNAADIAYIPTPAETETEADPEVSAEPETETAAE